MTSFRKNGNVERSRWVKPDAIDSCAQITGDIFSKGLSDVFCYLMSSRNTVPTNHETSEAAGQKLKERQMGFNQFLMR